MDKTYSIDWAERKTTKTGKHVLNTTLKDETGAEFENVSIWGDFPRFADLMTGSKVLGNIYTNDKGYKTLYPPKTSTTNPTKNAGMGKELIKAKESSINRGMDRKEEGIKTSSTIRMAVDLALAEMEHPNHKEDRGFTFGVDIQRNIQGWRKWLLENWDIDEPTSPVDINEPPF